MKNLLFKPFERYSENKLLITGLLATVIGIALTYFFNCKFIGVLKLTFTDTPSIKQSIIDSIVITICLSIFLFIAAKIINKKTRLIDIVSTSIVSFIPFYLLPLFNIRDNLKNTTEEILKNSSPEMLSQLQPSSLIPLTIFSLFTIIILVWFIALLYNGYKTAANAKGTKAIFLFVFAIILAHILSRILINYLN